MNAPPLDSLADDELLDRHQRGEGGAFAVLLSRYERPLYNFVLRSVGHPQTTEDLVQDVFMRAIQHQGQFRGHAKLSTWLFAIARNLCIDHTRRMRHRRHRSLDQAPGAGRDSAPALAERLDDGAVPTDRQAAAPKLQARILAALAELPEEQREVFLLRQLQQLPFADIARIVNASENTVKSRMRYALSRLQDALSDCHDHLDDLEALG